jgi:hypothetical protein
MLLNVVQINSSLFTHFRATKRLVSEISDTGLHNFQQLYDDAADVGFAIRNSKTGNVTRWALQDWVCDGENEVIEWAFVPTPESLRADPTLSGYTITLLND